MVDVVRQRPMGILHPYTVEVYLARDGSEACLSLNPPKVFCARDGTVKEVKLEFSRYEVYEEKTREVHRPKGLLAFTTAAREYTTLAVFPPSLHQKAAALRLASFRKLGLLTKLAEAAGATTASIRKALQFKLYSS